MPFLPEENWYDDAKLARLVWACERVRGLEGAVIEIGCWAGRSTAAIANAVHPQSVHAVDHWRGTPGDDTGLLAQKRDVYADFKANMQELTQGNVIPHRMDWREFADLWNGPIKFLHIDADHRYEEISAQLKCFAALVVPGGIICGDDYDLGRNGGVVRAVREMYKPVISTETAFWYWVKP